MSSTSLSVLEQTESRRWHHNVRTSVWIGVGIVALYCIAAVLAPLVIPEATPSVANALAPPSLQHPFGTDALGRDELTRVIYAARVDIPTAVLAAILPAIFGTALGALVGYGGRAVDSVMMRVADGVQAFPHFILLLVLVFIIGQGARSFIVASLLVSWVAYARLIRAEVLRVKSREYVLAARVAGLPTRRIVLFHVIPNTIGRSVVYLMSDLVILVLALASLSYLGLGIAPPTPEWGSMIAESQPYISHQWWLVVLPGVVITAWGIGLSLIGDALDEWLRA